MCFIKNLIFVKIFGKLNMYKNCYYKYFFEDCQVLWLIVIELKKKKHRNRFCQTLLLRTCLLLFF